MKPLDVLREYWGHEAFRPMQEQVISEALAGRDVLAMLPTGGEPRLLKYPVDSIYRYLGAVPRRPLIDSCPKTCYNVRE